MKKQSLIMWFICFLRPALSQQGFVCNPTNIEEALIVKVCQNYSITSAIVYLDSFGFPVGIIGECACTVISSSGTLVSITSIPYSKPGKFALLVDGNAVQTPVMVPYKSGMKIVLRKPSTASIHQCLNVTGAGSSSNSTLHVACSNTIQEIASDSPSNTESLATTQSGNTPASTGAPSGSTFSTESGRREKLAGGDTSGSGGSNIGIIAGAVVGGLALISIIVVVVIILLRRTRKARNTKDEPHDNSDTGKDPEYDMTVNDGYVSADYVVNPRKDAQRPMETYEDIADADATSKTFSATDHDASEYAVVNKSSTQQNNKRYDFDEETEYDSLTDKTAIRPTGNIYGVALPIQPNNSDA